MSDLLPCPFCGGSAALTDEHETWFMVQCGNDKCPMDEIYFIGDEAECIKRWNNRSLDVEKLAFAFDHEFICSPTSFQGRRNRQIIKQAMGDG